MCSSDFNLNATYKICATFCDFYFTSLLDYRNLTLRPVFNFYYTEFGCFLCIVEILLQLHIVQGEWMNLACKILQYEDVCFWD